MDLIFFFIAIVLHIKKRRAEVAFIFLTLLSTCWDTVQNSSWPFPHRMCDLGIILGVFITLSSRLGKKKEARLFDYPTTLLFMFAAFNVLISIIIALTKSISVVDIYKTTRFFTGAFLSFSVLCLMNYKELKRLLTYLLVGNVILCTLIMMHFLFGIQILKYAMKERTTEMTTFGIYPPESLWISIMLLFINKKLPYYTKTAGIVQGFFTTIITLIRSYSFVVFASAAVLLLLQGRKRKLSTLFLIASSAIVFYFFDQNNDLSLRFFSQDNSSAILRQDYSRIALKYCNEESPLWGGSLEQYDTNELKDYKSVILDSPDYSTAFLVRFGWIGSINWGLLILLLPIILLKKHPQSPYVILSFLFSYIYIPIESCFSNILLRPHCLIPLAILYACASKDDSCKQSMASEEKNNEQVSRQEAIGCESNFA